MNPNYRSCDVVVVGAGVGGISAAAWVAEHGKKAILLEAGTALGGTAAFSGGMIHLWGDQTWEEYRQRCPNSDPALARAVFDGYQTYVRWLQSIDAPGRYGTFNYTDHFLTGYQIGGGYEPQRKLAWFDYLAAHVEHNGGAVLRRARALRLLQDGGAVAGVVVDTPHGELTISASAVILATGGFQNDRNLIAEHLGSTAAANSVPRAVETDRGDGLRMALEAGGCLTDRMDTFYGHLMPALPAVVDWGSYLDPIMLTARFAEQAVAVNVQGRRFVDEGAGDLSALTVNAAISQPDGGLWLIMDDMVRRDFARYAIPGETLRPSNVRHLRLLRFLRLSKRHRKLTVLFDGIRFARARGAVIVDASTLSELADKLAAFGVDASVLLQTLTEFNAAAADGRAAELVPPKTIEAHPISVPPFLAMKVAAGISMTYGGVRINERAEVLDVNTEAISGLYAVPGTAGGIHHLHYGGSLASCGVFGMIAGQQVAPTSSHAGA